jgi:uncharacterized protein YgfB (UPF0149 family)
MWLATSHKQLTFTRLMRLEQWQEELQAGLGLSQQQLMQVGGQEKTIRRCCSCCAL